MTGLSTIDVLLYHYFKSFFNLVAAPLTWKQAKKFNHGRNI